MATIKTKVIIKCEVTATIIHDDTEDITKRDLDIYIHGAGENGYLEKDDLGADIVNIIISK